MRIGLGLRLAHRRRGVATSAGALAEPADIIAGSGNVAVPGSGGLTEPADAISGAGSPIASGSGGLTEPADAISGSGPGAVSGGSGALTEPSDTIFGTGNVAVPGAGSLTEPGDGITGTGNVAVPGSGAVTEAADTIAGSGSGSGSGRIVSAPTITQQTPTSDATPDIRVTFADINQLLPTDHIQAIISPTSTVAGDLAGVTPSSDYDLTGLVSDYFEYPGLLYSGGNFPDGSYKFWVRILDASNTVLVDWLSYTFTINAGSATATRSLSGLFLAPPPATLPFGFPTSPPTQGF